MADGHEFLATDEFTIAGMAVWHWYPGSLYGAYHAAKFLNVDEYPNLIRWYHATAAQPAVAWGRILNRTSGQQGEFLRERHAASDFG